MTRDADLRELLRGPVVEAAGGLLGATLVREDAGIRRAARIVEVEAYAGPEDRASHARFGPASRAGSMFAAAGRAYVYGVYGMHTCLNVVIGRPGEPAAVLLRAATPVEGADAMRAARLERAIATRRADRRDPAAASARIGRLPEARLASGPGNLAAAFGVTRDDDGIDLLDRTSGLRLEPGWAGEPSLAIVATARVGVAYAGPEWAARPWRFVIDPAGARKPTP